MLRDIAFGWRPERSDDAARAAIASKATGLAMACFESTERRALHFRVNGYGILAELVVSPYQSITSLKLEKL
jgi:hypothetical protein